MIEESESSRKTPFPEKSAKKFKKITFYVKHLWSLLMGEKPVKRKERSFLILFLSSLIGIGAISVVVGLIIFVITLRGMETVVIPDVEGYHVVDAIVQLQERGITSHLVGRYHRDSTLKNHVLGQDPAPGTVVRLGKQVQLMVSRGTIIDVVRDYVGRPLDEVQLEIQQVFSSYDTLMSIGNVSYVFSSEEPGTIIEQDPPAETSVSDTVSLDFLVSRGAEPQKNIMDNYIGMDFETVLQQVSRIGMQFQFELSEEESEAEGVVIAQSPNPEQALLAGRIIHLVISSITSQEEDLIFGLFPIDLDYYEAPVNIQVNAEIPHQPSRVLLQTKYLGGALTVPFLEPEGTILVVYRNEEAIFQHVVVAPSTSSS